MPAFPSPAMTYPSAVGGRRKAVPLDRDSPKPLCQIRELCSLRGAGGVSRTRGGPNFAFYFDSVSTGAQKLLLNLT